MMGIRKGKTVTIENHLHYWAEASTGVIREISIPQLHIGYFFFY